VTTKPIAAKVISIHEELTRRCKLTAACGQMVCAPRCDHGRCR
jgi:hypothetical protein